MGFLDLFQGGFGIWLGGYVDIFFSDDEGENWQSIAKDIERQEDLISELRE